MSETARKNSPAEVFFLSASAGRLFVLHRPPQTKPKAILLIAPAFAEEMNKSRRMYTLLADALTQQGVAVVLPDLFGTGDSEGDFADARWDTWLQDLESVLQWLQQDNDAPVSILGHRLGALLATELASRNPGVFDKLLMWQPISKGKNYLTRFLRLRMAASMLDSSQEKETTQQLRQVLADGESVEVAGYRLHPELANAIDTKDLVSMLVDNMPQIHWFDLSSQEEPALSAASRKNITACEEKGIAIHASAIRGDSFWSTVEIATVPALITATTKVFV